VVSFRASRHFITKYGALEVDLHSFLSSALDSNGQLRDQPPFHYEVWGTGDRSPFILILRTGKQWSASGSASLTPGKPPHIHTIREPRVGPKTATDEVAKRKILNSGKNQSLSACHKGLWRKGGKTPLILKFGTIRKCVVKLFFSRFSSGESVLGPHEIKTQVVLRGCVDTLC
jgi:hypothetical protein